MYPTIQMHPVTTNLQKLTNYIYVEDTKRVRYQKIPIHSAKSFIFQRTQISSPYKLYAQVKNKYSNVHKVCPNPTANCPRYRLMNDIWFTVWPFDHYGNRKNWLLSTLPQRENFSEFGCKEIMPYGLLITHYQTKLMQNCQITKHYMYMQ